jgi:hypothetical protein
LTSKKTASSATVDILYWVVTVKLDQPDDGGAGQGSEEVADSVRTGNCFWIDRASAGGYLAEIDRMNLEIREYLSPR